MDIKQLGNHTIKIIEEDGQELAETMIRFQEYYESQHADIKGKIFTLGYLKSKGLSPKNNINLYCGGNSYEPAWGGYNFPDYVLKPFTQGLFDPLTEKEQDIIEALRYRTDKFYVIGIAKDYKEALDHEECHALYYLSDSYRKEVNKILSKVDTIGLCKMLKKWGYHNDVLLDECHAYISADYDSLYNDYKDDMEKYKIKIPRTVHTKLRNIKRKYKKCL